MFLPDPGSATARLGDTGSDHDRISGYAKAHSEHRIFGLPAALRLRRKWATRAELSGAGGLAAGQARKRRYKRRDDVGLTLNLDLAAELDDTVGRNAEELGRVEHVVRHQAEEPVAPAPESGAAGARAHSLAADDEGCLHQVEAKATHPALRQGARDVGLVHKTVADADRVETLAELSDLKALLLEHMRHVLGLHLHHYDPLVQHLVVLEGVEQRQRNTRWVAGHEDRRPGNARRVIRLDRGDEFTELERVARALFREQTATAPPCRHDGEDQCCDDDREPAALGDLQQIGAEKCQIDEGEDRKHGYRDGEAPSPAAHIEEGQPGGDRHHAADRDAIGGAEIVRGPESEHQDDDGNEQAAVDARHVNLTDLLLRGVANLEPRQIPELDRLAGDRERAR